MDNFNQYSFDTRQPIGFTQLYQGYDLTLSSSSPEKVTCRYVELADFERFMKGEGIIYYVLKAYPHKHMPTIRICVKSIDGKKRAYVVFNQYYGDLQSYIDSLNGVPIPEATVRNWFSQLVDAVKYCHLHRISLRDMKLSKVMFADAARTQLVIADLTNAMVVPNSVHVVHDLKGSPFYVAPEVLYRCPCDPFKTDIWSLGVMLFVLLTGYYPFQDDTPAALFRKITSADAILIPNHLSSDAQSLLIQMLNRIPSLRSTIAEIKAKAESWVMSGSFQGASQDSTPPLPILLPLTFPLRKPLFRTGDTTMPLAMRFSLIDAINDAIIRKRVHFEDDTESSLDDKEEQMVKGSSNPADYPIKNTVRCKGKAFFKLFYI